MNPTFARKLSFHIRKTNVRAQKIDSSALETLGMVIADFQLKNKGNRPRFFQKTFLVADIQFKMVLKIPFLKISNTNMSFGEKSLT